MIISRDTDSLYWCDFTVVMMLYTACYIAQCFSAQNLSKN
jgi:hypothetical protein